MEVENSIQSVRVEGVVMRWGRPDHSGSYKTENCLGDLHILDKDDFRTALALGLEEDVVLQQM